MSNAPPLDAGEEVIFDHIPSLRSFKRTALLMLAMTLPAVVVFLLVFPDSFWPAVPLFVTCLLLMQERFRLGRYRAWITNQRIIEQGGRSVRLSDVQGTAQQGNGVRVAVRDHPGKGIKLYYPEDGPALVAAITKAKEAQSE